MVKSNKTQRMNYEYNIRKKKKAEYEKELAEIEKSLKSQNDDDELGSIHIQGRIIFLRKKIAHMD